MKLIHNLIVISTVPAALLTILLIIGIFYGNYSIYRLYTYEPPLSTRIYDRNGTLLYQMHGEQNRIWVPLEKIPDHLKKATIATEDHRFYNHPGVDPIAIFRAAKSTFIDGEVQGGSTLTQQYIKNAHLSSERTLIRKIKEAFLATLLESFNTKDQILEKYLNQVPYGGVHYGVETASQYYFGKSVTDLSLAESAVLAAITKAPSDLSPKDSHAEIIHRQRVVLANMEQQNFITSLERKVAEQQTIEFKLQSPPLLAPHFVMATKQQLIDKYGEQTALTNGLKVYTSLDYSLQTFVQEVVTNEVNQLANQQVSNGAAVVLDPRTGEVLAMVGSKDYNDAIIDGKYNVILAKRQPGSTFKPFVYALAFEKGYQPSTIILDVPTTYSLSNDVYKPVNYDGQFHGPVSIRHALGNSYNIPATRMLAVIGVPALVNQAHSLGFTYIDLSKTGLSLALGGYEVRPLDLASAYTVFANEGNLSPATLINKVADRQNKIIYERTSTSKKQLIEPSITYQISDILSDNSARSQAFGSHSLLHIPNHKIAVKTGTSNHRRDNWAVGYTPDFVIVSWVGNNNHNPMGQVVSGVTGATPIWRRIADHLFEVKGSNWYQAPANLEFNPLPTPFELCPELTPSDTNPSTNEGCLKPKRLLVENRDGQEVIIEELNADRYQQFQSDPLQFIANNKDILQADDKPTPIYIKEEIPYQDPLMEKYPQQQNQTDQFFQQAYALPQQ